VSSDGIGDAMHNDWRLRIIELTSQICEPASICFSVKDQFLKCSIMDITCLSDEFIMASWPFRWNSGMLRRS
jgi:hypothetical protein